MSLYEIFLNSHSIVRQLVLISLLLVLAISLVKWTGKKPFGRFDDKLSLYLLIFTNIQAVLGLCLYFFMSPFVQFSGETMGNKALRYWTVEHILIMVIAVGLISIGRSRMRKQSSDERKFKTLFIFNAIALLLIIVGIATSGRPWI